MMAEQRDNTAEGAEQTDAKTASANGAPPDLDVLDQALGPMNLQDASEPLGGAARAKPTADDDGIPGVRLKPAARDSRATVHNNGPAPTALESKARWDVALGAPMGGTSAPLAAPEPSGQMPVPARASNGAREAAAVSAAAQGSLTAATTGAAPVERPVERQVVMPVAYADQSEDADETDQEMTLVDLRRQMRYMHPSTPQMPPDGVGTVQAASAGQGAGEAQGPDATVMVGGNGATATEARKKPKGVRSAVSAMRIISVGENEPVGARLSRDSAARSVSKRRPWKSDEVNVPITPRLGRSVDAEGADDKLEPLPVEEEKSKAGTPPIGVPRPYPRAQNVAPTAAAMEQATSGAVQDDLVHDNAGVRGLELEKVGDAASAGGGGPDKYDVARHSDAGHDDAGHSDAGHSDAGHDDAGHSDAGHDDAGHDDEELEPEEDDGFASPPVTLPRAADGFDDEKTLVRELNGASFQGPLQPLQLLGAAGEPAQTPVSSPMAPVAVAATLPEFAPPMVPPSQVEMPISAQDLVDVVTEDEPLDLEPEPHEDAKVVPEPPFGQMSPPTLPMVEPPPGLTPPPVPTRPALEHDETPPPPVSTEAPSAVRKQRKGRQGWESAFADEFTRAFRKLTPRQLGAEVSFIERSLGIQQGGVLLDLGCGHGQHAVELASRGYNVVGFDLSLTMLAMASDEAHERQQKINFLHGDMRDMAFDQLFDGVYCWSTSFGFFDDETNIQVIQRIHRALRTGGMFLLDMVNRDYICARLPSLVWFEGDGCVCIDDAQFNSFTSRIRVKRTIVTDDGMSREVEYTVRLYSLHEIGRILHEVGFKVVEVSGHPASAGAFFDAESPRLITLAVRR